MKSAKDQSAERAALAQRQTIDAQLITKAWVDDGFRQKLLADPKAAIEQAFRTELPKDVKITVLQEEPKHFYLILPARHKEELSDAELEQAAGGVGGGSNPVLGRAFGARFNFDVTD